MEMTMEQMQEALLQLKEENETLRNSVKNMETNMLTKDDRIKSLEEHNQKLFLRVTTPSEPKLLDEEPDQSDILLGAYAKLLDMRDIESLNNIVSDIE